MQALTIFPKINSHCNIRNFSFTLKLRMKGCRVIGLDVSPVCIQMAKSIAKEEGLCSSTEPSISSDESPGTSLKDLCNFYEVDATIDPNILLNNGENNIIIMREA